MSAKYKALVVIFDNDIHEDDIEKYQQLFHLVQHVIDVQPMAKGDNMDYEIAESRVRRDLQKKLWDILYGDKS